MAAQGHIDEDLYSRMMYALGKESLEKMSKATILLIGCDNLGVEIAKNCILGGISVYLYDPTLVTEIDIESNIYIKDEFLNKRRDYAIKQKLQELNPYSNVKVIFGVQSKESITNESINDHEYTVVVTSNKGIEENIHYNYFARERRIPFVSALSEGLFGRVFNDFGDFNVIDNNGEPLKEGAFEYDSDENIIITYEDHDLQTGESIKIENIDGIYRVNIIDKKSFKIENISDSEKLSRMNNKRFVQVKIPETINFCSFEEFVNNDDNKNYMITDLSHIERIEKIGKLFDNIDYVRSKGSEMTFQSAYDEFLKFVDDENLVKKFVQSINCSCIAIDSIIGGFASQEITKACTNKLTPLNNAMIYSAPQLIDDDYFTSDLLFNNRYSQKVMWGNEFENKLMDSSGFIVGAGAIGCEHLKNYAMLGIASGGGKLYITDMDTIERSNLSRQFLFRSNHIGKPKSETASAVVKAMKPTLNIESHNNAVSPMTRNIYNVDFFNGLDFVANALDNIDARKFMDDECVFHMKPLLESGTLGTKGNVQVILPNKTLSYNSTEDPPEETFPLCTIKNFPYKIDHTISWARDKFNEYFEKIPFNARNYLENDSYISGFPSNEQLEIAESLKWIFDNAPRNIMDCIKFAIKQWHVNFNEFIVKLLEKYPENYRTSQGSLFWSGNKRCPILMDFDLNDEDVFNFIVSCTLLWAYIFDIDDNYHIDKECIERVYEDYLHDENSRMTDDDDIVIGENEEEEKNIIEQRNLNKRLEDILPEKDPSLTIKEIKFEKDDPLNHHIDFINSCSNIRAKIYGIETVDKHTTKGIAGKIIPALATTTSLVSGLVAIETLKVIKNLDNIKYYNDSFMNLAIPYIIHSEPSEVSVMEKFGIKYTLWDRYEMVDNNPTVKEILEFIENITHLEIETLTTQSGDVIYSKSGFFMSKNVSKERINMIIKDIIESNDNNVLKIFYMVEDDDSMDDSELPPVIVYTK